MRFDNTFDRAIWEGVELTVRKLINENAPEGAKAFVAEMPYFGDNIAAAALRNLLWLKKVDDNLYYDAVADGMALMMRRAKAIFGRWSPTSKSKSGDSAPFWAYYKTVFHRVFAEISRDAYKHLQREGNLYVFDDQTVEESMDAVADLDSAPQESDAVYDDLVNALYSKLPEFEAQMLSYIIAGYQPKEIAKFLNVSLTVIYSKRKVLLNELLPDILLELDIDISHLNL